MAKITDGNVERYVKRLFLEEFAENLKGFSGQNEVASPRRDLSNRSFQLEETADE